MAPLNVEENGELEALFETIGTRWGRLDSLVHSIAFAPKEDLQGGLIDCSAAGFARAMDVSCHSFVRMAKLAAPLMKNGGTMFAMSYLGAERVVTNYNVMGPVKAALEAACRYLAFELGKQDIRVTPFRPGLKTRAAHLISRECSTMRWSAPLHELVDIEDVGSACAYLASDYARRITGGTIYIDGGANIVARSESGHGRTNCRHQCRLIEHQICVVRGEDEQLLFRGQVEISECAALTAEDAEGNRLSKTSGRPELDHGAATRSFWKPRSALGGKPVRESAIASFTAARSSPSRPSLREMSCIAEIASPLAPLHQPQSRSDRGDPGGGTTHPAWLLDRPSPDPGPISQVFALRRAN
jgi:enoyl-[acyl-carrier protein] reductase I